MEDRAKRQNIFFLILWNAILLLLILLIQGNAFGQYRKASPKVQGWLKNWSINVNGGKTTFFGDVSLYDDEFSEKLRKESSWAYGFILSRQMSPVIGLSGQLIFGSLVGTNSKSRFEADIMEYSFSMTFNLLNILIPKNDAHFFPYLKFGLGQFKFNSTLSYNDPNQDDRVVNTDSPEFLYLFGAGAFYKINHTFDIHLEITSRMIYNDRLDGTKSNKDYDYYAYLSLGVTYKINNKPRDPRCFRKMGMKSKLIRRR